MKSIFLSVIVLSSLVLLSLFAPSASQVLVNVTGTATCTFTTFQGNQLGTSFISYTGNLTVNLTARGLTVPNTPGFTNQAFVSYPIIRLTGNRTLFVVGDNGPTFTYSNITGIGANRTIYMTVDVSQDPQGFPTDAGFGYRFDFTGITILTNSPTLPSIRFAEVDTSANGSPYSELQLNYPTVWAGSSFSLSSCTQNYTVIPSAAGGVAATGVAGSASSSTGVVSGGSARGDPSFTGFRGQTYQVHGMADTVYNVITDKQIQLNALFVFLTEGECPVVDGHRLTNCWSHPGSYFGALALRTASGHKVLLEAGSAKEGLIVTVDSVAYTSPVAFDDFTVTRLNSHRAVVEAGVYRLVVENSDNFINLMEVDVTDWQALRKDVQSHGLLGQTWRLNAKWAVEGEVDDYAEGDNQMFGTNFLYNKHAL